MAKPQERSQEVVFSRHGKVVAISDLRRSELVVGTGTAIRVHLCVTADRLEQRPEVAAQTLRGRRAPLGKLASHDLAS